MEAPVYSPAYRFFVLVAAFAIGALPSTTTASGYKTANFVVSAPTPELAREIGESAEAWRKQLAVDWLGEELLPWSKPCPIHARVAPGLGAGGATSFVFDRGEVFGWKMTIQGSRERILDSVLPHEITHTVFASHFRQPLPRWADEGACTTVEHHTEVAKQERMLIEFLKTGRGISFGQLFAMKEYPADVMPLYSQGHSVAQWLIESQGRQAFLEFLSDGMSDDNWPRAVHQYYGFSSLQEMQEKWLTWVKQGRPRLSPSASPVQLATASDPRRTENGAGNPSQIYRGQSPDVSTVRPEGAASRVAAATPRALPAGESVYAAAAAYAERQRAAGKTSPAPSTATSVYDAVKDRPLVR